MAALTAGMNRPGATADLGPGGRPAARTTSPAGGDRSAAVSSGTRAVRSWPLLVLAAPAAAEVWSGWVGIAQKTGFGLVSPLPGIWPSLHLDTSITLPVGVEAYAAYALRAWLADEHAVSGRTRRFARWSAICSFTLGRDDRTVAAHRLTMRVAVELQAQQGTLVRLGAGVASLLVVVTGSLPEPSQNRGAAVAPGAAIPSRRMRQRSGDGYCKMLAARAITSLRMTRELIPSGGIFGRSVHDGTTALGSAPSVAPHGGNGDEHPGGEPDQQDGNIVAGVVARGEPAYAIGAGRHRHRPPE